MERQFPNFWEWFFSGSGGRPGYRRIVDRWLVVHMGVGAFLAWIVAGKLSEIGKTVLLPLAGVLVGLSFAWAGNAYGLLQTEEMWKLAGQKRGGLPDYVYTFQVAILTILVTMGLWGLAALGVADHFPARAHFVVEAVLFTFASLTFRECWHVVLGTQWMLLARKRLNDLHAEPGGQESERPPPPPEPQKEPADDDGDPASPAH